MWNMFKYTIIKTPERRRHLFAEFPLLTLNRKIWLLFHYGKVNVQKKHAQRILENSLMCMYLTWIKSLKSSILKVSSFNYFIRKNTFFPVNIKIVAFFFISPYHYVLQNITILKNDRDPSWGILIAYIILQSN